MDDRYKRLRDRCNDHTHYNFFRNVMLNDNKVYIENRGKWLERFAEDALDCGVEPEENSQYWVAPFIQDIFNEVVTPRCPDITATIKANSAMHLL